MPKGTIRNPGTKKSAEERGGYRGQPGMNAYDYSQTPEGKKAKAQRGAKAANMWNEEMRKHFDPAYGGHANKGLRASMKDVRSTESTGGALSTIKENPVKALTRRASDKSRLNKG